MAGPFLTDRDGEVRELTIEDLALFAPIRDVDPEMARPKGPEQMPSKVRIDLRLAADIVEGVLSSGPGYEERVERVLRRAIANGDL